MKIEISELRKLIEAKFLENKVPQEQVKVIVDYLMWAEMSGISTQGIVKMFGTEPLQDIVPKHNIVVERETPCSILYDAGANNSIYTASIATEKLIEKTKQVGIGIAGVRNTFSSNGAQGYYLKKICDAGYIGIMCSRSPGAIAPYNSISPLFGTNPLAFGFPTKDDACIFDMASSAITFYGLIVASHKGEQIGDNLAINSNGELTNNPDDAMNGAILPFDRGYKSSNLAMMVELLSGPLLNSAYCDYKTFEEEWGTTILAINPEILTDIDNFLEKSSDMLRVVRESQSKNNDSIRLPGEESLARFKSSQESGEIEIDDIYLEKLGYQK